MSLVGPRPCIPYEAQEYLRWHAHRFDTLPGMTGLWQVSGKNKLTFEQMVRLDIAYGSRMSLLRDLRILLLTGPAIIKMTFEARAERSGARVIRRTAVSVVQGEKEGSLRDA
jgi:exopolysaccharide production protein ExoY